jgi:hypothetical protein
VGQVYFLYLGLPIGGDPRRLGFWYLVATRIKNILSGWKSLFLSFGGRLILLKSIMISLSLSALSFFKALGGGVRIQGKPLGLAEKLFSYIWSIKG